MSELPAGVGLGGQAGPAEVLALRYESSRLHSLGLLLQALILSLRIAYSFSQHLAQLSLGLCGFPLGWLPLCHRTYVGMPEAELNPCWDCNQRPAIVRWPSFSMFLRLLIVLGGVNGGEAMPCRVA